LKKLIEATPDGADVRRDLGHALADKGSFQQASVQLEEANRLSGGRDPLTLHLLGRVYADLGRFAEAAKTQRQALAFATDPSLVQAISAQLEELRVR
jgi:Flp pilus assembly protein TadD